MSGGDRRDGRVSWGTAARRGLLPVAALLVIGLVAVVIAAGGSGDADEAGNTLGELAGQAVLPLFAGGVMASVMAQKGQHRWALCIHALVGAGLLVFALGAMVVLSG
jgi:hypothetical protein